MKRSNNVRILLPPARQESLTSSFINQNFKGLQIEACGDPQCPNLVGKVIVNYLGWQISRIVIMSLFEPSRLVTSGQI